LGYTWSE